MIDLSNAKIGDKYKTRNGFVFVYIGQRDKRFSAPYIHTFHDRDGDLWRFMQNGRYWSSHECEVDIVEKVGEQLCDDEGCSQHGTPHVCVSRDPSERIRELLEANDRYVERARAAEAEVARLTARVDRLVVMNRAHHARQQEPRRGNFSVLAFTEHGDSVSGPTETISRLQATLEEHEKLKARKQLTVTLKADDLARSFEKSCREALTLSYDEWIEKATASLYYPRFASGGIVGAGGGGGGYTALRESRLANTAVPAGWHLSLLKHEHTFETPGVQRRRPVTTDGGPWLAKLKANDGPFLIVKGRGRTPDEAMRNARTKVAMLKINREEGGY